MHSSLLLEEGTCRILIDCGRDWLHRVEKMQLRAIFLTHAHSDHAGGIQSGAPCEVFAASEAWRSMRRFAIRQRSIVRPRVPIEFGGVALEAFAVEHSLLAPAVGYRITCNGGSVFYVPDIASRVDAAALSGISIYIGDGATIKRPLLRKRENALIGHAPVRAQLEWCKQARINAAIFTHCGSQIVAAGKKAEEEVEALGRELAIDTQVAFDGLQIRV